MRSEPNLQPPACTILACKLGRAALAQYRPVPGSIAMSGGFSWIARPIGGSARRLDEAVELRRARNHTQFAGSAAHPWRPKRTCRLGWLRGLRLLLAQRVRLLHVALVGEGCPHA